MNKQEVFDTILTALRKQKVRSMDGTQCAYRSPGGNKCAIGHLILDEEYHENMEGVSIRAAFDKDEFVPFLQRLEVEPGTKDLPFLRDLQEAHDVDLTDGVETFESAMACIAARFQLTYTPPEVA